jgi:hypothetical protein
VDALLAAFGKVEGDKPDEASATKEGLAAGLAALREGHQSSKVGQSQRGSRSRRENCARRRSHRQRERGESQEACRNVWTEDELSWLAKATKKIPAGYANRWETVATYTNTQMRPKLCTPKT